MSKTISSAASVPHSFTPRYPICNGGASEEKCRSVLSDLSAGMTSLSAESQDSHEEKVTKTRRKENVASKADMDPDLGIEEDIAMVCGVSRYDTPYFSH